MSKVLVLTSFCEGFPTVVIEAMNMGNAIITVRYDGFSDELLKSSNTICTGYDQYELAAAVSALTGDEERVYSMGCHSYKICERFSMKVIKDNFLQFTGEIEKSFRMFRVA